MNNFKPRARDQIIRFKFPNFSNGEWNQKAFFSDMSEKDDFLTLALLFTRVKIIDKGWH